MEQYIRPCIEVCTYVFKNFVGTEITATAHYFSDREVPDRWDISALISLSGQAQGVVAISMKQALALQLTGILTGAVHTTLDEDVMDALGEILNIIAGRVKQRLENTFNLIISLPTIILGIEHTVKWPIRRSRLLCIPFTIFGHESFVLSIAIQQVERT
ncbi:MAG: chemotaxis protein CheX [Treponema sp.]|jgi:chemotaxis protein CheX|nr:chemotaxis protein CheX [Treponema sp.]